MNKKFTIISVMLSLFLFLGAAFVPIRVEAAYGEIGSWTGNMDVTGVYTYAYIIEKDNFSYSYNSSVGDITSDSYYALYEMNIPVRIKLTDLVKGYYYNGNAIRNCSFTILNNGLPASASLLNSMEVSIDDYSFDDNITLDMFYAAGGNPATMQFRVCLDNYASTHRELILDFNVKIRFAAVNNANSNYAARLAVNYSTGTDTTGVMDYYSDVRDLLGYEGAFANQNQQIIDGIEENTGVLEDLINNLSNWFEEQKNNINTRFTELISNLTSWYNGLTDTINNGIDRLLTSYTGTGTTEAAGKFDDSAGELQTVESDLTGITNSCINDYSTAAFDTSIITTLGPSLVYVVTWFTNFWNMGGIFTSLLNVGLALFVAFFILRLTGGSD